MGITLAVVGGIVLLVVIGLVVSYNRFVRQRNLVQESWRQIDVELQRRYDLIPNLIETVRAYAAHEREVLQAVTEARAYAQSVRATSGNAPAPAQQAAAEGALSGALGRLLLTAEAYPDLKANQNFLALQNQLVQTEDRIAAGRQSYNSNVRGYNTRAQSFPSNLIAGMFNFKLAEYFEVNDPVVRAAPRVDFTAGPGAPRQVPTQANPALPPQYPGQYPPATPGYPSQPGTPAQAYPSAPGYPSQPGMPAQGYPTTPGDPSQPGTPAQAYPTTPGYPSQPATPAQGYPSAPGYPSQPATPAQAYPSAPGYPSQPATPAQGYPTTPGYPSQPGTPAQAHPTTPGYPSQPGMPAQGYPTSPGQPPQQYPPQPPYPPQSQ